MLAATRENGTQQYRHNLQLPSLQPPAVAGEEVSGEEDSDDEDEGLEGIEEGDDEYAGWVWNEQTGEWEADPNWEG